ncbi:SDR family NAD(P)-dependent oxidoreductase [Streptomyces sp. NPDC127069]|uniref:SDR family NAD(P)-dependent oxidoreductase n=1 Tax=Streptomyces sp. NPDC127069 TaxID=3347128 RepID=UPI00364DDF39
MEGHSLSAEPIAVIGIGCRFPGGADSPQGLWKLLLDGVDTVGPVPRDRWNAAELKALQHPDDADRYDRGCFIDGDIWAWEPAALSVAPREGELMDPQHRLAMEVAWEAVENAGIPVEAVRGSRTGVYLGLYAPDNLLRSARPVRDWIDGMYLFGNLPGNATGRITFAMDLRGPAMVIETMCSSGLVAVHQACKALAVGECDMALAGASLLMASPETLHYEAKWLTSARGRCYAFDPRADGYVRGEGAGMLLLKRFSEAVADGDRVLAVLRGSAVTSDGQSERMTAPSAMMQERTFRLALADAGVRAEDVGYVEAHGPGTFHGDPIEYTSINAVYGRGPGRCALGSLKTNIGHSEPTSGIGGLIKAVLAVRSGVIPPNLHFSGWNPSIPLDAASRLFVPTEAVASWPVPGGRRLAGVCSYGIAGTNAHVIVEQPPEPVPVPATPDLRRRDRRRVFPVSSFSPPALPSAAVRLARWVEDHPEVSLRDVAHTLAVRRSAGHERLAVVAGSRAELVARLRAFADGEGDPAAVRARPVAGAEVTGPVLVFTGQGSQWAGMCQGLLDQDEAFTEVIDRLEPLVSAEGGFSLREVLGDPSQLSGVDRVQPTLFAVQVALAAVWQSWGVRPAAVIGHSLGEVAAAVVAGRLSLLDGVKVICRRALLLRDATGGRMASVTCSARTVAADLEAAGADRVNIAVYTSPANVVVAGDRDQVEDLVARWQERGEGAGLVRVDYASHSPHMQRLVRPITEALADLEPRDGTTRFYTTVGEDPRAAASLDGAYWAANLRAPVRFEQAVRAALADGHRLFIECTTHPLAVRAIQDTARGAGTDEVAATGTLRREVDDEQAFLESLAAVHCAGARVDWSVHVPGRLADLPTATWHRTRQRFDPPFELIAPQLVGARQHSLLGGHVQDPAQPGRHLWQTPISPKRVPWLQDHQVAGVPVMPGAGMCEMVLSAAAEVFGTDHLTVRGLRLSAPLLLEPEPLVSVCAEPDGEGTLRVEISTSTGAGTVVHATATAGIATDALPALEGTDTRGWETVLPNDLYAYFRSSHQVRHDEGFQGLEAIHVDRAEDRAQLRLRIPDPARASAWMMLTHPALLDSAVQGAIAVWQAHYQLAPGPVVVAGFDRIQVNGPARSVRTGQAKLTQADDLGCTADLLLAGDDGVVVASIHGLRVSNITTPEERFTSRLAHLSWTDRQPPPVTAGSGRLFVLLAEDRRRADPLAAVLTGRGAIAQVLALTDAGAESLEKVLAGHADATVVYLPTAGAPGRAEQTAQTRVRQLAGLLRLLAPLDAPPRFWAATLTKNSGLTTAGLRGLLRTAAYEYPQLAASMLEADDPAAAALELLGDDPAIREVRLSDGRRRTHSLSLTAPPTARELAAEVRPDAAYLVTGGLGGLGLLTGAFLADQGAARIVLCSRHAPQQAVLENIETIRANGCDVRLVLGDMGDAAAVAEAIHAATEGDTPLRGVVHAAGTVEDALLDNLDDDLLSSVWRGKATGAWKLHQATLEHELDFFVLYSSVAALIGSPGQAAYAAANSFLDDLADHRRSQGLPATSVQWGAWSNVGAGQGMQERGFAMIKPTDGIDALNRILTTGYTQIGYSPIDIRQWLAPYPRAAVSALFHNTETTTATNNEEARALTVILNSPDDAKRRILLHGHIIDTLRTVLNAPEQHITPDTSMVMLGLDSLGAMQLRQRLQRTLDLTIDTAVLWTKPTPAGITDWILQQLGHPAQA